MRRIYVAALAATAAAAFAAALLIFSEACAAGGLLDPGWQIVYAAPSSPSSGGGLLQHLFGDGLGQVVVARPYQPAPVYGQPAPVMRAYQGAPPQYAVAAPPPSAATSPAPEPPPRSFFQLTPPPASVIEPARQQTAFAAPPPGYVPSPYGASAHPAVDPKYDRQIVDYDGDEKPGTIIVDTAHFFLYLVLEGDKAMRYGIGVGRPGFAWAGVKEITAMHEWPDWYPPPDMLRRRPDLPRYMAGGPDNPLGARALYLGSTLYRIHGSNEPWTIGARVSSGCIRLRNADVIDLYDRVKVGTKVVVL